jgi:ribosomal protein L40E
MPVCGWLIDAGGRQCPLDNGQPIHIGRDAANTVLLSDVSVSRAHAEIFFQGGMARVRDLGSANGTFVDGTGVTDCALYDGQSVRIGSVGFTYRSATNAQQRTILIGDQRTVPATLPRSMVQQLPGSFCQSCGSSNKAGASFCTKCGSSLRAIRQAEVQTAYRGPQVQYVATSSVNAGLAAVLSFFWCGLGHIYAGKIGKGYC